MTHDKKQFKWISGNNAVYPPGSIYGPRTQSSHEFILVTSGSLRYQYNNKIVNLDTNHLLLAQKGFEETYIWDKEKTSQHDFFHFNINHFEKIPPIKNWPISIALSDSSICFELMKYVLNLGFTNKKDSKEMEYAIFLLLKNFIEKENTHDHMSQGNFPREINAALLYVSRLWQEGTAHSISIKELCENAHTSPTQLTRLFKRHFKFGPIQLLRNLRLKRASIQLLRTSLSIEEISTFNGFENQFHFSKTFKKVFGISPSYYRKNQTSYIPDELMRLPLMHQIGII